MFGAAKAGVPSNYIAKSLPSIIGIVVGSIVAISFSLLGSVLFGAIEFERIKVLGLVALILGIFDVACILKSCGIDRETVGHRYGWVNWSIKNSAELSMMIVTRPGLMSLYTLMTFLLLVDNLIVASAVGAIYGSMRSSAHWTLARSVLRDRGGIALVKRRTLIRRIVGTVMLMFGSYVTLFDILQ